MAASPARTERPTISVQSPAAAPQLYNFSTLGEAIGHFVFQTLVNSSVHAPRSTGCRYLDAFILSSEPTTALPSYCKRLAEYMRLDEETQIVGLVLMHRVAASTTHRHSEGAPCPGRVTHFDITRYNVHRLMLVAFVLAAKSHNDCYYPMTWYGAVGGVPARELIQLELVFSSLLEYRFFVEPNEHTKTHRELLTDPCMMCDHHDAASLSSSPGAPPRSVYLRYHSPDSFTSEFSAAEASLSFRSTATVGALALPRLPPTTSPPNGQKETSPILHVVAGHSHPHVVS